MKDKKTYFTKVSELQSYSTARLSARVENMRLHRMKKGTLGNLITKHSPDSLCKDKNPLILEMLLQERSYRAVIKSLQIPISVKIM